MSVDNTGIQSLSGNPMVKLSHLHTSWQTLSNNDGSSHENQSLLCNLQTMGMLSLSSSSNYVLARTPNLRKLSMEGKSNDLLSFSRLTNLANLNQLEMFKIRRPGHMRPMQAEVRRVLSFSELDMVLPSITIAYPSNLKKLTLSGFPEDSPRWNEMSDIEKLPNLEVLILEDYRFPALGWETSDGSFPRLKVLKLLFVALGQWISSSSHFPSLERLVVDKCHEFEEIPSGLGEIPTLQTIEVCWSSVRAVNSARQILEEQHYVGNYDLKVVIYPRNEGEESD